MPKLGESFRAPIPQDATSNFKDVTQAANAATTATTRKLTACVESITSEIARKSSGIVDGLSNDLAQKSKGVLDGISIDLAQKSKGVLDGISIDLARKSSSGLEATSRKASSTTREKTQGATVSLDDANLSSNAALTNPDVHESVTLENRNAKAIAESIPLYDRINKCWETAEEHFRKKGILAPVIYTYNCNDSYEEYLGLQKLSGKWRICIGYMHYGDPEHETTWSPVSESSLDERITLLEFLPDLFESLVESNEKVIPNLRKLANKSEEFLRSIGIK